MDDVDKANNDYEQYLARQIAHACPVRITLPSAFFCQDCHAPIPEKRRQLISGVTRCVNCQSRIEKAR